MNIESVSFRTSEYTGIPVNFAWYGQRLTTLDILRSYLYYILRTIGSPSGSQQHARRPENRTWSKMRRHSRLLRDKRLSAPELAFYGTHRVCALHAEFANLQRRPDTGTAIKNTQFRISEKRSGCCCEFEGRPVMGGDSWSESGSKSPMREPV